MPPLSNPYGENGNPRAKQVFEYWEKNDDMAASKLAQAWLAEMPHDAEACFHLAESYRKLNHDLEADLLFHEAIRLGTKIPYIILSSALYFYHTGQIKCLVDCLDPYINNEGQMPLKLYIFYAECLMKLKRFSEVEIILANLMQIEAKDFGSAYGVFLGLQAEMMVIKQDTKAAIQFLTEQHEKLPQSKILLLLLSNYHENLHDFDRAILYAERLLALIGDNSEYLFALCELYHKNNDYQNEMRLLQRILAIDPLHSPALLKTINYYQNTNNYQAAIELANQCLQQFPTKADFYFTRFPFFDENTQAPLIGQMMQKCWELAIPTIQDRSQFWQMISLWEYMRASYMTNWNRKELPNPAIVAKGGPMNHSIMKKPYLTNLAEAKGKTLLLIIYGGMGDRMQWLRFFAEYEKLNIKIIPLWFGSFEPYRRLLGGMPILQNMVIFETDDDWHKVPDFDYYVLMVGSYYLFQFPKNAMPKPYAPPVAQDLVLKWRQIMGPKTKPRIGLVVSGDPNFGTNDRRSSGLKPFITLLSLAAEFMIVQKDLSFADRELAKHYGIRHIAADVKDLADTAALLHDFDLVVGTDSGPMSLAASYGVETWVALHQICDWRYYNYEGDFAVLFPNQYYFYQTKDGDWDEPISRMKQRLMGILAQRKADGQQF